MASSRLLQFSFISLRFHRNSNFFSFSPSPHSVSSSDPLLPFIRFSVPQIGRFKFFSSISSVAIDSVEAVPSVHPWPEWGQFVEKIRSKGYFEVSPLEAVDDEGESFHGGKSSMGEKLAAVDTNRLKNACLKFARERFDILRSLPKEDIRAVVECGCPNLFRKSVNSAKRLRAFLRLDEAEVCGACNIRGSCDRAYKVVHEEEEARTVDIMRILLSYAINPTALLGGENPPVKVQVQESACKLLSEIIRSSDTIIDPALLKPILNLHNQKEPYSQLKTTTTTKNKNSQNVEMKKGDWLCPNCNFLNFARNIRCLECKADGPKKVESEAAKMKPGDWICTKCDFMNFARNRKCFRCLDERPKRDLNPGDWECPECDFLNFSRNQACRRCNLERPSDEGSALKDHLWRKPGNRTKVKKFRFGDSEEERTDSEDDTSREEEGEDIWPPSSSAKTDLSSARKRNSMSSR